MADPAPTPEEVAVRNDVAARVAGAVDQLPSGQREAVHLFYLRDLSHREVAAALDIEVNAVKARLHRARRSLRPLVATLAPSPPSEREERPMALTDSIDLRVADVRRRHIDGQDQHVVTLRSEDGDVIPIWIGPSEAVALALRLTGTSLPRPLTYDTMASLVRAAHGRITEVSLVRLEDTTYYAEAVVESAAGTNRVDLRPSDALNLALTVDVPIRTTRALFDAVGAALMINPFVEGDFPDDAAAIAAEIEQQWERGLEWFRRQRRGT